MSITLESETNNEQLKADIVTLNPNEWEKLKELRLKALQTDPDAFGRLYEEDANNTEDEWRAKLGGREQGKADYYFARLDDKLVGMAGIRYEKGKAVEHMASLIAVYVDPEYRGKGIGNKLMNDLVDRLRADPKITKVTLSVQATQQAAISMYKKLGFQKSGYSRNEIKHGDRYIDQVQMDMIFDDRV